jgi:hypothetical protein
LVACYNPVRFRPTNPDLKLPDRWVNRSLALELAQRDSPLDWMCQREGDNMKATEYFQKALKHPIHEVQSLAIAQLSKSLAQNA